MSILPTHCKLMLWEELNTGAQHAGKLSSEKIPQEGATMIFSAPIWLWVGFNAFVLAMLALDLGVFHWAAHIASLKEALSWSIAWIMLALIFNVGLYMWRGSEPALQFLTGYLIEKSLSVDTIFVLVFASIIDKFYYLRLGLAVILTYVGVKMVLTDFYHISPALSLLVDCARALHCNRGLTATCTTCQ